jgi:DNA-binding beta-propeller fold protein YncE
MVKVFAFVFILYSLSLAQSHLEELGRFGGSGSVPGKFKAPCAIDRSEDGRIFICDRGNQRIQVFDPFGNFRINFGGFGWDEEKFDGPADIWARSTINIYVADYNNQRVQRFDKDLNYISSKISNPGEQEKFQFREVLSVAFSPQGDLFILEAGENKILKFNNQDQGDVAFGYYESGEGELTDPVQLELSSDHRVVVSDAGAKGIFVYDYFGTYLFQITHPEFKRPMGIAHDSQNRIYVADPESNKIFEFTSGGKFLNKYSQISGIPFSGPMDLVVTEVEKQTRFYIIDGDDILIANKVSDPPKE